MRLNGGEWRAKIDYHTHSHKNLIKSYKKVLFQN